MSWKENLEQIWAAEERRKGLKKLSPVPADLLTLTPGQQVYYVPPSAERPHYGERVQVLRPPRADVRSPSARVQFKDGAQASVPVRHLRRLAPPRPEVAELTDARSRPTWSRLVKLVQQAQAAEQARAEDDTAPDPTPLRQEIEQRARQLAGMVAPRAALKAQRADLSRVLLEALEADAYAASSKQPGRGGRGLPRAAPPAAPSYTVDVAALEQESRAMLNNIAKCIHRRYFLSDRELRDLTQQQREEAQRHRLLSRFINEGLREVGGSAAPAPTSGKGSAVHGRLHDHLTAAYPLALEACQLLAAGKPEQALALAEQVQHHRAEYLAANAEIARARRKHHTGRYFHGDVLSVREEHPDGSMTQYYARVTIIYGEDGFSLLVANAAELEALTGMRVGPAAWGALCRWIEDLSDRAGGQKQGRRQDDDEHLIYRDEDGYLRLRPSLEKYSGLLAALECIRRALLMDEAQKDVLPSEIPEGHPAPGHHGGAGQDVNPG